MLQNLTFVQQINTVYNKCSQLMGCILRTFISRERTVMLLLLLENQKKTLCDKNMNTKRLCGKNNRTNKKYLIYTPKRSHNNRKKN